MKSLTKQNRNIVFIFISMLFLFFVSSSTKALNTNMLSDVDTGIGQSAPSHLDHIRHTQAYD